jgi:hypothetical protein
MRLAGKCHSLLFKHCALPLINFYCQQLKVTGLYLSAGRKESPYSIKQKRNVCIIVLNIVYYS